MNRTSQLWAMPFVRVSAAKVHSLAWRVVRQGLAVCKSGAALGRLHQLGSSISAMSGAHSRGSRSEDPPTYVRQRSCGCSGRLGAFSVAHGSMLNDTFSPLAQRYEQEIEPVLGCSKHFYGWHSRYRSRKRLYRKPSRATRQPVTLIIGEFESCRRIP